MRTAWVHIGNDIDDLPDPKSVDHIIGRVQRYSSSCYLWRAYDESGREHKGEASTRDTAKECVENAVGTRKD
jgi:hypothetical protein